MATLDRNETKIVLDIQCPDCDGNGFKIGSVDTVPDCETCGGTGRTSSTVTVDQLAMHLGVSSHKDVDWNEEPRV